MYEIFGLVKKILIIIIFRSNRDSILNFASYTYWVWYFVSLHLFLQRVNIAVKDEYLRRVYKAIASNAELESIEPGIGNINA